MHPNDASADERLMRRAMELAARGRGSVEPNPMVGCVIAVGDRVIADGYHQKFGGPHAEREALAACRESARGATVYVNLEPCCHTDKKTAPCVPALIEAGVARVVLGCVDPNPQVAGKGIHALSAAGIAIKAGVLERECKQLNAAFFARIISSRPYVTLKWAQSADGKVAGAGGARKQISNELSMKVVHELRARSDAIMVGIGTVLSDDPILTARGRGLNPLLRVVMDSSLRIPLQSRLVKTVDALTVIYCTLPEAASDKAEALRQRGLQVIGIPAGRMGKPAPRFVLNELSARGVTNLIVDAGPTLGQSLIDQSLADRIWVIHSPMVIGAADAPDAPVAPYQEVASIDLKGDRLVEMLNPYSEVFFAPTPSADMQWAREMVT